MQALKLEESKNRKKSSSFVISIPIVNPSSALSSLSIDSWYLQKDEKDFISSQVSSIFSSIEQLEKVFLPKLNNLYRKT